MMMLREHEIGDRRLSGPRRLSEPSYSVAPISFMDPTVCITMCCSLLYHVMVCVHLIIYMLYYCTTTGLASTSVFGCLWLSVVLVILVHDSWVNRLVYILRENSNCTEESTRYWVIHRGLSLFIRIRSCTCFCSI